VEVHGEAGQPNTTTGRQHDDHERGDTTPADDIEQRVVAFAEQLGRIAGTVQAKAAGWLDRETLNQQMASIRDGASELLERLAGRAAPTKKKPVAAKRRGGSTGRSGGVVDAPGKKHRKPLPPDPGERKVASQRATLRTAQTMAKRNRRRGRG
jgi:hypothetical protein